MSLADTNESLNWHLLASDIDRNGYALVDPFLSLEECAELISLYENPSIDFRSTIDMARFNFGIGEYKYFDYPLPPVVHGLRESFYGPLARISNDWAKRLSKPVSWPRKLSDFTSECQNSGQRKPTPLLLRYTEGGYNCLHQDLYGSVYFPLQVIVLLSEPGTDFEGGELILVEQRPRMQSRPMVVPIQRGGAAIIPVRERPEQGAKRIRQVQMRHGVSGLVRGARFTLGLIFHDAQ